MVYVLLLRLHGNSETCYILHTNCNASYKLLIAFCKLLIAIGFHRALYYERAVG